MIFINYFDVIYGYYYYYTFHDLIIPMMKVGLRRKKVFGNTIY